MPRIPSDDDGPFGPAEPPELSEAAKHAMARQQKLDDANFITERTLAFKNEMAAEFERSKRDGDAADPMFEPNIMKFGFEMRSSLLSDIPRGPWGRLISQDAIEKTRSNMEGAMERFSTAALHHLNLERHSRAFANIEAAGEEFAKAAGRDARGLQGLLITVDNLMDQYEGVFADGEIADQRARIRTGTVIAAINGLIEQGKTGFARELIQKGAFDADLGDQPARLLLGRIAKTEQDNAFKAAEETVRARRLAVAEIGLRVRKGQLFPAELDAALAQGTIGPEEHADFLAKIEKQDEDRAKRIEDMVRVSDLLARGEKPDADDAADRAAIDAKFEGLTAAIAERPPEERAFIETRFVRRTGMLPATLRDRLLSGMYSEDPAAQVAAAGRLVAFDNSDPTLTAEFPDDMHARARAIEAFAYPGLTPARIVQVADEWVANGKPATGIIPATARGGGAMNVPRNQAADALFKKFRGNLKSREGKFVSHPRDPGGPTEKGFSQRLLNRLRKEQPGLNLPKSTKNLTPQQIDKVFRQEFYDRLRIKKVWDILGMKQQAPQLPEQLFDSGILHGITNAGKLLQQSLDDILGTDLRGLNKQGKLIYDGNVGPKTRAALARAVREGKIVSVNNAMADRRLDFMKRQREFQTFKGGWVPRAESFRIAPKKP